jgi:hypothetical protein
MDAFIFASLYLALFPNGGKRDEYAANQTDFASGKLLKAA